MLENVVEHWFIPYDKVEKYYGYNTEAYKSMMNNRNHQNWNARQGIIFKASW